MLKTILLFGIFAFCSLIGIGRGYALKKRVLDLSDTREMIERIGSEIRFSQKNIFEILQKQTMRNPLFCLSEGSDLQEQYIKIRDDKKETFCFREEDWKIIDHFFFLLGKSDIEGQTSLCANISEQLREQEEKAEYERAKYAKMYISIGVLAGLFFVIILL